ncbi:MAG: GxxExxY protein, partial [Opitutaceae bacterium]
MNSTNLDLSGRVIGAAIRVHEALGPGFLESFYEEALCIELNIPAIGFQRQLLVPVRYRDAVVGEHRVDLLVENSLILELKAIERFEPIHFVTLRSYLKATNCSLGLLLNFAATTLKVKR